MTHSFSIGVSCLFLFFKHKESLWNPSVCVNIASDKAEYAGTFRAADVAGWLLEGTLLQGTSHPSIACLSRGGKCRRRH